MSKVKRNLIPAKIQTISTTDIKKMIENEKIIFYAVSILFAVILAFANKGNDDIAGMHIDGDISSYWKQAVEMYSTWSSRTIINFVVFIFTGSPPILWAVYMGVSMFILLNAISMLFVDKNKKECNNFIACMVMLYPFSDLCTAGWIATSTTYFCPTAFGIMSLVPIKKILRKEIFKWWEYITYTICLIYGANNEQMMLVILACYAMLMLYFIKSKKLNLYALILFFLAVGSCIFTLACPGNSAREYSNIISWFPTYGMLNMIDKIDLGYSTTLHWLLFQNHLFVIVICVLFAIFIWKKYNSMLFRTISVIPVFITVLWGTLKDIVASLFSSIGNLANDIPYYGLVTVENRGDIGVFVQFLVMGMTVLLICVEIMLLEKESQDFFVHFTFLISSVASRVYMGFSPTIYASGYRTCEVMSFGIIMIGISLYVKNIEEMSGAFRKKFLYIMNFLLVFSFIDLCFLVYTVFK